MLETSIGGRRVGYRRWGSTGPWVTLLHGGLVHSGSWDDLGSALAQLNRVIAPDLAGYGASDPHPDGPTVENFAADVASLWADLWIPRSAVVGFSMGGFVALQIALTQPGTVSALGLIGTASGVSEAAARAFAGRATQIENHGLADEVQVHLQRVFSDGFRAAHPDLIRQYADTVSRARPETLAATFRALGAVDLHAHLGLISCPTLVLVGGEDAAIGTAGSEALARGIPDATLQVVGGAGHTLYMEQLAAVVGPLRALLDGLPPCT